MSTSAGKRGSGYPANQQLQYGAAVTFAFGNPNWMQSLLFGGICLLVSGIIPVLGQLVWVGYVFEVVERLHKDPESTYPEFSLDRLVEYLSRGVWPFLVSLGLTVVLGPLVVILFVAAFICSGLVGGGIGGDAGGMTFMALMIGATAILIPLMLVATPLTVPFFLSAGLSQDLKTSFNLAFAKDFIRTVWIESLMAGAFALAVYFAAYIVGAAMLCVGLLFTMAWFTMVQGHLAWQLYEIYLARGGERIPLKSETTHP